MNKLTKLLSVFLIAGAIGAGVAGVAGCAHKHVDANGDGICDKCEKVIDESKGETGDQLTVKKEVDGIIVEGVTGGDVQLSETKTSHDLDKSAIKVYFATGSTKGDQVPADNLDIKLSNPAGAAIDTWTGLKTNGTYKIDIKIKNAKMEEGSNTKISDLTDSISVNIKNAVKEGSLALKKSDSSVKDEQVQGPNTISSTWKYEVTRANGDKEDVAADGVEITGLNTIIVGDAKEATISCTINDAGNNAYKITGKVTYKITADATKVSQAYALNFASLTDAEAKDIADGKKVTLQNERFEIVSMSGGSIDNDNNEQGTKYFTKRLKTNGASTKTVDGTLVDKDGNPQKDEDGKEVKGKVGAPSYIKVHADGAGTLTVYAYNNGGTAGDNATRGVSIYKGVTFTQQGQLDVSEATRLGAVSNVPSKTGMIISVSVEAAGDYYITHDAAMTYRYVQLDQIVDKDNNTAVALEGTKTYAKISVSHPTEKFKGTYKSGDEFVVDSEYKFKGILVNNVTCESDGEAEIDSTKLSFWLGETNITSGYHFTNADCGATKTVTVKVEGSSVTATFDIGVESKIAGVYGITAKVEGVNNEVDNADGKVTLKTEHIKVGLNGSNSDATATLVSATYKLKGADGAGADVTAEGVELGIGEYEITVIGSVSLATGEPEQFSVTISFKVSEKSAYPPVVVSFKDMEDVNSDTSTDQAITGGLSVANSSVTSGKIVAGASWQLNTKETTVEIDGVTYSRAFNTKGSSHNSKTTLVRRYIELTLKEKGNYKVTVYALSGSSTGTNRHVLVSTGAEADFQTASADCGTAEVTAHEFTLEEASQILVGGDASILIYAIVVERLA